MTEKEAIVLNLILEKVLNNENPICSKDLKTELLMLEENESEHENLLERLSEYLIPVTVFSISNVSLNTVGRKNSTTKKFYEAGGFIKQLQDELDKKTKKEEKEQLEIDLAKSNIEANILNIENSRKNKWYTWTNIAIGFLNLVLLALQLLKD